MSQEKCNCGCMGMGPMMTEMVKKLCPSEEVSQHFRAARVEVLKGLRAMLDEQIADLGEQPKHGTKIPVE